MAAVSLAVGGTAHAGEASLRTQAEYTDFDNGFGTRSVVGAEVVNKSKRTTTVLGIAHGERNFEGAHFDAFRISGAIYHNWNRTLSTRTGVTLSSNEPVFVHRELSQEVSVKVAKGLLATAGAKALEYYGDVDATAWNVGASYYLPRLTVSYKYTRYDVEQLGESGSSLVSFRLRDRKGDGYTQLWLGQGNTLHEFEWASGVTEGRIRGMSLRRFQPVSDHVGVSATVGYTDRCTGAIDYHGATGALELTYRW